MKIFLSVLILIFILQSWTKAEDIGDFQIEGISVGDNLSSHFSKIEIKNKLKNPFIYPNSKKFVNIGFNLSENEKYDSMDFHLKKGDNNFTIYGLKGKLVLSTNECLKEKKKISNEIGEIFKNSIKKKFTSNYRNSYGKSKAYVTMFELNNGNVKIFCTKYDKKNKIVKSRNLRDGLMIGINSKELTNFINNEAY